MINTKALARIREIAVSVKDLSNLTMQAKKLEKELIEQKELLAVTEVIHASLKPFKAAVFSEATPQGALWETLIREKEIDFEGIVAQLQKDLGVSFKKRRVSKFSGDEWTAEKGDLQIKVNLEEILVLRRNYND